MSVLAMFAAAGVWPALPLTGYMLLAPPLAGTQRDRLPPLIAGALMIVAGLAAWSALLLGTAMLGIYHAACLGTVGWGVTLAGLTVVGRNWRKERADAQQAAAVPLRPLPSHAPRSRTRRRHHRAANPSSNPSTAWQADTVWTWILAAGLVLAAALYLGFPAEGIYGGRDEGVYANHAVYLAEHGRLDVPYPWPADAHSVFFEHSVKFPGFYRTEPTMTVQFGHLFPIWLAQAFATAREHGLFRLNALFACLSLVIFYGLCRAVLSQPYAVIATLFLAFNPAQLWTARITLSEVLAQLLIGSGLLAFVEALRADDRPLARWAGVFFGLAVFVRLESVVLLPLLLLSHALVRVVEGPQASSGRVWPALYQTVFPVLVLGLAYFAFFSTPYFTQPDKASYLQSFRAATTAAVVVLLTVAASLTQDRGLWPAVYRLALPVFGATLAYCLWDGTPLLAAVIGQPPVRALLASTLVTLAALAIAATGLLRNLRPWLLGRATLTLAGTALCMIVAYAYWIRSAPSPAPQLSLRWPGYYIDLSRDYSRDTLVNLGRYVSPPLICAAVLGWIVTLWDVAQARRQVALVPLLVVALVVSAVHLRQPIAEDHIWIVRRYVPVAIPSFVVCAAFGVHWILARFPNGWAPAAGGLVVLYLVGFTAYADRLFLTFAEDKGYFAQIEHLAQLVPRDELILARGHTEWITPLYVSFGRRVVPLNLDPGSNGRIALQRWVDRQAEHHRPAYLLLEGVADVTGFQARQLGEATITRTFSEPTTDPLPKKIVTQQHGIRLYEIRPES